MMTVSIDESGHSNFGIIRDRTMGTYRRAAPLFVRCHKARAPHAIMAFARRLVDSMLRPNVTDFVFQHALRSSPETVIEGATVAAQLRVDQCEVL